MSVQAITSALGVQGVSSSEKLLLIVLANYADEHGRCWPSQARLGRDTCLSDRTIRNLLSALEERSLLQRRARYSNGSRTSDMITLKFIPETISAPPEIRDRSYRKSTTKPPETISGEPIIEPSKEPSARVRARDEERAPIAKEEREAVAAMMRSLAQELRIPKKATA